MRTLLWRVTLAIGLVLGFLLASCNQPHAPEYPATRPSSKPEPSPKPEAERQGPNPPASVDGPPAKEPPVIVEKATPADGFSRSDVRGLLAKADRESGDGDYDAAGRHYRIVLAIDPGNRAARDGLRRNEARRSELINKRMARLQGSEKDQASGASGSTTSDDEVLAQSLAHLSKGNLAYSTPEKMKTGQTANVVARIGADKISISTLKSGMPTDQAVVTATAPTPISTKMKMTLKSADFDITALSSEEQFVGGDTPTAWEWDVSPKHSGKLRLHLAAVVVLNNLARDFTTVDRDITVQVDPINAAETFAKANGVWILTTLGAGLAGLWAFLKKRKKATRTDPPNWETP